MPSGYTLIGASSATVTVSNGRANPSSVTFRYQPYQPTATPVVGVTIPVNYIDASNRVIYSTSVSLTSSQLVYANTSLVPGYSLTSASSVYVTVRNGTASPASVTFRVAPTATPTPAITQISLQVRYMYGSRLVGSQTVYLRTGTSSYVYADQSVYGSSYVLNGSSSVRVTVSASGVASPSVVTFNVTPRVTPSPTPTSVPVFPVSVPVRYLYGTRLVASQNVSIQNGTTTYVYADASVYGSQYELTSASSVRVTVSVAGVASPATVTFYLTPKATPTPSPTAVPIHEVPVTVRYMSGSSLIASYQEICPTNATTTVYADPSVYEGKYILQGDSFVNVTVDARGVASPAFVSFYLTEIPPEPVTPAPSFAVAVPVEYRYGNELIYNSVVMLDSGTQTMVQADPSVLPQGYVFDGSDRVTVTVSADGIASPSPIIYNVRPDAAPVTPEPAPTAVPTTMPPTGDINQELPAFQTGKFPYDHDVYLGPGTNYHHPNKSRYTSGVARIYGTDGEWLLMGYELSNGNYRIGYIHNYTLPSSIDPGTVPAISYAWIPTTVIDETVVTDDPVINSKVLEKIPSGTPVTFLAWSSEKRRWAMIEYQSSKLGLVRAFVKGNMLACMQ